MKGTNFFRLLDDQISGRSIPTGVQSPFALPAILKEDGKTFSGEIDWEVTFSADNVRRNSFADSNRKVQEIGSYQVTFKAGNGFDSFTSNVSFGTIAEAVNKGAKAQFIVKASKGKNANPDGTFPVYFNIEPEKPVAFSAENAMKVKQALLTIAGANVPELETA